jgi:multimeric flavodoxin WrbA
MKIISLIGSYRKNGNTARAVELFHDELTKLARQEGMDLEIETLYLGHQNIQLCRGCRVCFDKGETYCPLNDDLLPIKEKILQANGVITASPVYVDDASGIIKNWIDRMPHICHRPEFTDKPVVILVTSGSSPTGHTVGTLRTPWMTWGGSLAGTLGLLTGALSPKEEIAAKYQKNIARAAKKYFYAVKQEKYKNPGFISLMVFRIQQWSWEQQDKNSIDYQYWKKMGWLDSKCDFFISHAANPGKVILARLLGSILARFFA